jgi:hypothetical protein
LREPFVFQRAEELPIIVGVITGSPVTLISCFRTMHETSAPGLPTESFRARFALPGAQVTDPGELRFDRVELELTHSLDWATISGITQKIEGLDSDDGTQLERAAACA